MMIVKYNHHTPLSEASDEELTQIKSSLYHVHLPKLEDTGVIEYDPKQRLVKPTAQFDQLQPHLSALIDADPDLEIPVEL
nr:transcriptional regulator [Haladaptatus halobius]